MAKKKHFEITISAHSGYCAGVKRAVDILLREAGAPDAQVFTLGKLIHNSIALSEFESLGVHIADIGRKRFPAGATVILPTHGTPPATAEAMLSSGVRVVDAVCPKVRRVQNIVSQRVADGYTAIIAGEKNHAEVTAFAAIAEGKAIVISSAAAAHGFKKHPGKKYVLLSQTTFSKPLFDEIESILNTKLDTLEIESTLCGHTRKAQKAAVDSLRKSDAAVIIGGRDSSNSRRLFEACAGTGKPAFFIESSEGFDIAQLSSFSSIVVCAGASTPPGHIEAFVNKLKEQS